LPARPFRLTTYLRCAAPSLGRATAALQGPVASRSFAAVRIPVSEAPRCNGSRASVSVALEVESASPLAALPE